MSYLGADGVGFGDCHGVTPATQTVAEGNLPINPHPHLQATVVVFREGGFCTGRRC